MSAHHENETPHEHDAHGEHTHDDVVDAVNALRGQLAGLGRDGDDDAGGREEWESTLEARERVIAEREQALARERAAIKAHRLELKDAQQQIQQASDDLLERAAAVNREKADLDRQKHEQEQALRQHREELEAESKRRRADFDRRLEEEAAEFRTRLEEEFTARKETLKAEISRQRESLEERERDLERRAVELENHAQQIEENTRALEERESGRIAELETALLERDQRLDRATRDAEALRVQFDTLRQEAQGAVDARAELESLRVRLDDAESREAELHRALAEARDAAGAGESNTNALREEIARRDQRISELEAVAAEAGDHAELAASFQNDLNGRDARIADLERSLEEALAAGAAADEHDNERLAALEAEIAARDEQIADLAASLEAARQAVADAGERPAVDPAEIEKRDRAIEKLVDRLKKTEQERDALAATAGEVADRGAAYHDEHLQRRRERLLAYRRMVETESRKINQAKRAVAQRHAEAEKVLQHRRAIAEMRQSLEKTSARLEKRAKRYNAARLALMLVTALGALAFGAWHAATMVPMDYLAHATLRAEPVGADSLTDEQLQAWRKYAGGLVTDPRLVELAAERMKRRGLEEFGSAPALGAKMNEDLDFSFPSPDAMTVTLKGAGDLATQRVLETYLATMVSLANDARVQRSDGANTNVAAMPRAEDAPLDEQRLLVTAGVIWGVGALVVMTFGIWGVAVFSRMNARVNKDDQAAMKAAFEWSGAEAA
jgi:hypothetical protein